MRIVLDLRIFGPQYGGLGRYNQQLLLNLAKFDLKNQYIILVKKLSSDLPKLPDNFSWKICPYHWYSLKEQIFLHWEYYLQLCYMIFIHLIQITLTLRKILLKI